MYSFSHTIRNILEGRLSLAAIVLKLTLLPFSLIYSLIIIFRITLYKINVLKSYHAECPVISIGNLSVGGTGKTPFTIFTAEYIKSRGLKPAVVSRGYNSDKSGSNDEEKLIKQRIPDIIYYSSPDRAEACRKAAACGADLIILDDGFQHLAVKRDLDIIMLDSTNPRGGYFVLPAGMLREPFSGVSRANIAVFNKSGNCTHEGNTDLIKKINPDLNIFKSHYIVNSIKTVCGDKAEISASQKKKTLLVSSIAKPAYFRRTAEQAGFQVVSELAFADHHNYTQSDFVTIADKAEETSAECILTTEKDIVKLSKFFSVESSAVNLYYVEIAVSLEGKEEEFFQEINKVITLAES